MGLGPEWFLRGPWEVFDKPHKSGHRKRPSAHVIITRLGVEK